MGDVIDIGGITKLNLDPERVIDAAKDQLTDVVIIGYDKDGNEYFASSVADGPEVLWMLERSKKKLLDACDE